MAYSASSFLSALSKALTSTAKKKPTNPPKPPTKKTVADTEKTQFGNTQLRVAPKPPLQTVALPSYSGAPSTKLTTIVPTVGRNAGKAPAYSTGGLPVQAPYGTDWEKRYLYNPNQYPWYTGNPTTNAQPPKGRYAMTGGSTVLAPAAQTIMAPGRTTATAPTTGEVVPPIDLTAAEELMGVTGATSGGGGGGYSYGGGGGGGGGGGTGTETGAEATWSEFDSGIANKPSWWKAMKPSAMDENTEYMATLNMMIPFLSPEDQKTVASTLYQMDAKDFGHLNPEKIEVTPETEITDRLLKQYTASTRAQNALSALTKLAGAVGKSDAELGPGYRYLRSIIDVANRYGSTSPTEGQTRRQYQQMLAALDPLLAESSSTTGTLAPYGSLVKMLSQPFFSGGLLRPLQKTATGEYVFGTPNKTLL